MSVIIKGLNKFYSCRLCPFNNSDCYCNITEGKIDRDDYSCESECPIVQLPKGHGRLGDLDELERDMVNGIRSGNYEEGYEKYAHINSMDDCVDAVKYADTIIEADKAGKRGEA